MLSVEVPDEADGMGAPLVAAAEALEKTELAPDAGGGVADFGRGCRN